jgi:hypothetical protein
MPPNRQRECESEVGLGASNARSLVGNLVLGMSTRCQPAGAAGHNRRRLSSRGNGLYSGSHKRAQAIPLTCQQKVLGSSPITRSSKPRERGFFLRRHPPNGQAGLAAGPKDLWTGSQSRLQSLPKGNHEGVMHTRHTIVLGAVAAMLATTAAASAASPALVQSPSKRCHPSYKGACLDPRASDYDCRGGSGNGPKYTGLVRVVGPDVFRLDADHDGWGCTG